jgi:cytochrome c-type protein NapB
MASVKYWRIGLVAALMLGGAFFAGNLLRPAEAKVASQPLLIPETIESEAETFRLSGQGYELLNSSKEKDPKRNLASYYSRRAFPGAPPAIPHPLLEDKSMGGQGCLGCHKDGGYVPPLKAYAPVSPHPQMENCRACHVAAEKDATTFRASDFHKIQAPAIDGQQLPGGPPPIPHSLQMRENCLACHAGPAAPSEIRTAHPERGNCRQCHVPNEDTPVFARGGLR